MTSIQLIVVQQHHMHDSGGNYWLLELYALPLPYTAFDHATYITLVAIVPVQECARPIVC